MAAATLYCTKCGAGYASVGEVPASCPNCDKKTSWTTIKPYHLTENDRHFLKGIHIDQRD